jgi:hypothetical protein
MKKLKPMRVLITGGRLSSLKKLGIDPGAMHALVVHTLNVVSSCGQREITVIHGGANGVDSMADAWAAATKTKREVYPVTPEEWEKLGKAAGSLRNAFMLTKEPNLVLAFPGGNGTLDMVARARHAKVKVFEVPMPMPGRTRGPGVEDVAA